MIGNVCTRVELANISITVLTRVIEWDSSTIVSGL